MLLYGFLAHLTFSQAFPPDAPKNLDAAPLEAATVYFFQRGYVPGSSAPATALTDAAVAGFTKLHPQVSVEIVGVPWGREGDLKLRTALLAGSRIDLFRLAHDQLGAFIPRKGRLLAPVAPWMSDEDRRDFGPAALQAVTFNGEVMAWPLWSTAIALMAHPQILKRAGITPPEGRPWTWDEFEAILQRIKDLPAQPGGSPVYGLTAAARPPLFEWAPLLMAHCGPLFTDPATDGITQGDLPLAPGLEDALTRVARWREQGFFSPAFGTEDQPAAQAAFMQGQTAFLLSSPGVIRQLVDKKIPFMLLPPPTGRWGQPITTGALGCFAVVESGDPARVRAAQALARYLTSAQVARDVAGWYLAPPARTSVASFYDDPAYAPLSALLPTARYLSTPLSAGFMENTFIPALQGALLGQTPPAQAIGQIQSAARRRALR